MPDHHAVLYEGRVLEDTPLDVSVLVNETELERITLPVLSIGAVRQVIQSAYGRPFEKVTKTIVFEVGHIAPEAQQALLKLLEEPPRSTRFILVMPHTDTLLPTLRSRLHQPMDTRTVLPYVSEAFQSFLTASYSDRIAMIALAAKDKDTTQFEELTTGLTRWLEDAPPTSLSSQLHAWLLLLPNRGSAKKMLWEDISLTLPRG